MSWASGDLLAAAVLFGAAVAGGVYALPRLDGAVKHVCVAVASLPLGFLAALFIGVSLASGREWLGENLALVPANLRPTAAHLAALRPGYSIVGVTLLETQLFALVLVTSYAVHTLLRRFAESVRLLKLARRVQVQTGRRDGSQR